MCEQYEMESEAGRIHYDESLGAKQALDELTKHGKNTDDRGLVVDCEGCHVAVDNRGCSLYSPDLLRKSDRH